MSFTLHHAIVHQLVKEKDKKALEYIDRKSVFNNKDKIVIELSEKVSELYSNNTKKNMTTYGIFSSNINRKDSFPSLFKNYHSSESKTDKEFLDLSIYIMDKIQDEYKNTAFATGGYVFITEYSNTAGRFLSIVMVKQKDSYVLTENLDPTILETLDLTKLHQAVRINYVRYQTKITTPNEDISYLCFISSSTSTAVADYFIKALGCNKNVSAKKMTSNIINLSTKFFQDDKELSCESVNIRKDVVDYLSECITQDKPARLSELETVIRKRVESLKLDEDIIEDKVQGLLSEFNSERYGISSEFNVIPSELNKYTRVSYRGETYSFNFENNLLGTDLDSDIYYDKTNCKLTFSNLTPQAIAKIESAIADSKIENQ